MNQILPNSLLLIGILPSPRDHEIARLLGWYRIPLKTAPKIVEVDYVAFYQGVKFGQEHAGRIEYFAEYRGHELTTRGELLREEKDHPRVNEEYYKIQLGPLMRLYKPILAGTWKRITFIYTTGELFSKARVINDLVVRSEERDILWKSLRERAQRNSVYKANDAREFITDPHVLDLLLRFDGNGSELDLENY